MTAQRWRQVEEIFHEAADVPAAERNLWLTGRCTGDAELEQEVLRMLAADSPEGATIERMIGESVTEWLDAPPSGQPERVGPWRIVRPLGSGGMGAVYLAARDDDSYRQLAAVKILRAEQRAPGLLERFRQERQILAELEHPNIARLLDGGTTADGRPYLVIEYVDGVPLTSYAAKLPLRDRCALMATVCDAVAFAHRNLIVHRDLKPANVLVDGSGAPKLLDFGIAKLIGVDGGMTASMHALFTPDYASPEQVQGLAITTATDVYALGAVLYEVLTGKPIRSPGNRSFAELVRDVTEGEIAPPSRVTTERIPADLDRIVEKALSREPERRYGTADQLAADLRRFLEGRPVEARGTSWVYSASKFARRHWLPLVSLAVLMTALAASTVWSLRQARMAAQARAAAESERDRAESERRRAESALAEWDRQKSLAERNAAEAAVQRATAQDRFERSRKLTHKFLFDVEDALKDTVGATKARQVLVTTALEHFEHMGREAAGNPALMRDLARAYDRIGDLQGYAGTANLGDQAGAVSSYRKSLQWHRKSWHDSHTRLLAAFTATKLAKTLKWLGKIPEAEQTFAEASATLDKLTVAPAHELELVRYRSNLSRALGEHWQSRDRHDKARDVLAASIAGLHKALPRHNDVSIRRLLSSDYMTLSYSLMLLEDWPEAQRTAEAGMSIMREVIGPNAPLRDRSRLIPPGIQLVDIFEHAPPPVRNLPRALGVDAEMIGICEKLVAADAANARNQALLANVLSRYAGHLRKSNRWPESLTAYERSHAVTRKLLQLAPANGFYHDLLGTNAIFMAQLLADMRDAEGATRHFREGIALLEKSIAAGRLNNKPNLQLAYDGIAALERRRP